MTVMPMRELRLTLNALIALLIGVGILLPAATFVAPAFERQVFAVRGESMSPTIPMGALIVVGERDPRTLERGDIVTWHGDNGVWVTHRVLQVLEENGETFVQTKGDANETPDAAAVPGRNIEGVVHAWVPLAGYLLAMLATPTGLISWLCFGLALLIVDTYVAGMTPRTPMREARGRAARVSLRLPPRLAAQLAGWRRSRQGSGWPIHFEGVTVAGDDLALLDDMALCAGGDHSRCVTEVRPRACLIGDVAHVRSDSGETNRAPTAQWPTTHSEAIDWVVASVNHEAA